MDHGHELSFGTFLTPAAAQPERVVALAQLTEQVGLDLVTVQDHPYQPRHLDTWTLLSVIAARTSTVTVAPDVANLPLRPPAVLARGVASLDLLTGGRVELGLGAGAFWDGVAALGGSRLTGPESVVALEEGIRVIRAMWSGQRSVTVEGEHHRLRGAHPGPVPAHDVGIWVGSYKPRMLRLTGRLGDGWLPSSPYAPPDALPVMGRIIDAAAEEAGRSPADVRRLYNVTGTFAARGTGFLQGPAEQWAEELAGLTLEEGFSTFIVMGDDPDVVRRFAAEVAPAVRDLVDAERARPAPTPPATSGPATSGPATSGPAVSGPAVSGPAVPGGDGSDPAVTGSAGFGRAGSGPAGSGGSGPAGSGGSGPGGSGGAGPAGRAGRGLGVVATVDDGVRLSEVRVWDEGERPTGPAPDPDRTYTPHEQAAGRHLIDVHDGLRSELVRVRDLIDQVAAGSTDPGLARSHINQMTMRQNNWTLGVYCESYCRIVTTHHTLEDQSVFPHLRSADPRLAPVVDRLEQEHHAIHDVLEGVDRALVAFVSGPDGMKHLRAATDLLTDTLLSHLAYEERELIEPLARLGF